MYVRNLSSDCKVTLFLVRNVKDIKTLRQKVISGDLDCCVVKPSLVLDPFQVLIAANKALINKSAGRLTTKSINSELLFNLSISKNITQSLTKFGINDSDKDILVVVFEEGSQKRVDEIKSQIEGDYCDAKEISNLSDEKQIAQAYKIKDSELGASSLLDSVISRIAIKDFGSF